MIETISLGSSRIVNAITAAPLLNLMLAMEGMEEPGDPAISWSVFQRFVQIPSASQHDVIGFQVHWIEMDGSDPFLTFSWVRQLTDSAAGYGEVTRAIQLEYAYMERLPSVPETLETWSDEFGSVVDFLHAVERQPQFTFLLENAASMAGVYVREDDEIDMSL